MSLTEDDAQMIKGVFKECLNDFADKIARQREIERLQNKLRECNDCLVEHDYSKKNGRQQE